MKKLRGRSIPTINTTYHVKIIRRKILTRYGAAAPAITTTVEKQIKIESIILKIKCPNGLIYNNNKS